VLVLNLSEQPQQLVAGAVPAGLQLTWQDNAEATLGAYQLQVWQSQ